MAETYTYFDEGLNNWLWAGYAFTLLAILGYIFSDFLHLPLIPIIALFVVGILLLIVGYSNTVRKQESKPENKTMFRKREF